MRTTILPHRWASPRFLAILLVLAALVCTVRVPAETEAPNRAIFRDIDHILAGLSEITGFKVRRGVPAEFIGKDQLRAYLERRIREEIKPADLRIEELTLKMFGLIPQDFDLRKATVDLISEQAAAFYDPAKRRLSIIEAPTSDLEQRAALVHELGHAIADQEFRLERYMKKGGDNDDGATARQAVMEGQATWLMWAYVNREGGGEAEVGPAALAAMDATADSTSSQYPALEGAPMYLRESLLFPYTKGLQFQDAIYRKLGKRAFAEVFRNPPSSTQQILHPDVYLARTEYPQPQPPPVPDEHAYRKLADGALGEFDEYLLLKQFTTEAEARRVSRGWREACSGCSSRRRVSGRSWPLPRCGIPRRPPRHSSPITSRCCGRSGSGSSQYRSPEPKFQDQAIPEGFSFAATARG